MAPSFYAADIGGHRPLSICLTDIPDAQQAPNPPQIERWTIGLRPQPGGEIQNGFDQKDSFGPVYPRGTGWKKNSMAMLHDRR